MAFQPSATYAELFSETLDYLRQSDLGKFIIDQLEESPATITVDIGGHVQKNGYLPGQDLGGTIHWNPFKQVQTRDELAHRRSAGSYEKKLAAEPAHLAPLAQQDQKGQKEMVGVLSPAMLLMHEMGHAYQRLSDAGGSRAAVKKGKQGVKELENVNVNAIENTVALELRAAGSLEGVRWRYEDIRGVGMFKDKQDAYEATPEPFPGWLAKHP